MTGLIRRATLLTAVGLMAAGAAMAGVPTLSNSTVPGPILIVRGYNSAPGAAAVDLNFATTITVRDAANNPVPNSVVVLNFAGCAPDIKIGSTQVTGFFVNCAAKTVSGVTDVTGAVTFRVVGAANTTNGADAGAPAGCISVAADGVFLGNLSVGAPDLNGARGNPTDPGMDGTDTAQYTQGRFPPAIFAPCTSTNPNFRNRANLNAGTPCAFQLIDGQDTGTFTLFRFGVSRNVPGGGTGTNGPFCP
jgi:hypothetical protein